MSSCTSGALNFLPSSRFSWKMVFLGLIDSPPSASVPSCLFLAPKLTSEGVSCSQRSKMRW